MIISMCMSLCICDVVCISVFGLGGGGNVFMFFVNSEADQMNTHDVCFLQNGV